MRIAVLFCMLLLGFARLVAADSNPPALNIISPSSGIRVAPGDEVIIEVSVSNPDAVSNVGIIGQGFTTTPYTAQAPFVFHLPVPQDLAGPKKVGAVAITSSGVIFSKQIIVEILPPSSELTSLTAEPSMLGFNFVGAKTYVTFTIEHTDGYMDIVNGSSNLHLTSENPNVAVIDDTGLVTAIGSGKTKITVSYQNQSTSLEVSVGASIRGDLNGDGIISMDDLNIIQSVLNTPASKPADARDLNRDGKINALDMRILTTLCTYPRCADHL